MSLLSKMEIFYHVASAEGFSKAAKDLQLSKSFLSMQVTALEKELGVRLLHRTTRHISMTEAGKLFFNSCANIIREKNIAIATVAALQELPVGNLKISAPASICTSILANFMPIFAEQYPNIITDIEASAIPKDLIKEGIDLAIRVTRQADPNYIARLLYTFKFVTCASPAYFQQNGTPKKPIDLLNHNCLVYSSDPSGNNWLYQTNNKIEEVNVKGNLISSNHVIVLEGALAGGGIVRLPSYLTQHEILNGRLISILEEFLTPPMPIYAIYATATFSSPKIKAFLAGLKEFLEAKK